MLMVIDIGNTNIVFGLFNGEELVYNWRISSDKEKTSDEYGLIVRQLLHANGLEFSDIKDVIIASVVPNLMHTVPNMCLRYMNIEALVVGVGTKTGMRIKYDNPKEVGADRIVNAVAGYRIYGGPLIIVDIGTAISFDVVDSQGDYLGGAIAPGIGIASESLFMKTSKLPKVELTTPSRVIGRSTIESIQSGVVLGYIGLIDRVNREIARELNLPIEEITIIGTGGYSKLIASKSETIQKIDKMITLYGLKMIYEMNAR